MAVSVMRWAPSDALGPPSLASRRAGALAHPLSAHRCTRCAQGRSGTPPSWRPAPATGERSGRSHSLAAPHAAQANVGIGVHSRTWRFCSALSMAPLTGNAQAGGGVGRKTQYHGRKPAGLHHLPWGGRQSHFNTYIETKSSYMYCSLCEVNW